MTQTSLEIHHVQSSKALREASKVWRGASIIALDTEFVRTNTYYPISGLIQIGCGDICHLIDPLKIEDLSPLKDLLEDKSILKILHACSEDLEVFRLLTGAEPSPLYDTQIAAALIGQGFSLSYQALVEMVLGVRVEKGETRSNWLQRPLTDSQCHYAALDVEYLAEIYSAQSKQLVETERSGWLKEECERLLADSRDPIDPEEYYTKVSSAWKLDRSALMVLKTLCAWREKHARKDDRPRNHVVREKSLLIIARDKIDNKEDLRDLAEFSPRQIRKFGERILLLASEARQVNEDYCPSMLKKPLGKEIAPLLKRMRKQVVDVAEEIGLAPEILAKKRQLESLINSKRDIGNYALPTSLAGWRKDVIGAKLMLMLDDES